MNDRLREALEKAKAIGDQDDKKIWADHAARCYAGALHVIEAASRVGVDNGWNYRELRPALEAWARDVLGAPP